MPIKTVIDKKTGVMILTVTGVITIEEITTIEYI
jgi:hypothetical protein